MAVATLVSVVPVSCKACASRGCAYRRMAPNLIPLFCFLKGSLWQVWWGGEINNSKKDRQA